MQYIIVTIKKALASLNLPEIDFSVTHPREESHGDYSVNAAMILAKQVGKNPRELAQEIVDQVYKDRNFVKSFEKVEVAGPGFINFYVKTDVLVGEAKKALAVEYGKNDSLAGQKTMVEFTDPNPFKEFHIGHLMSNTIGESLCRIFEANGATVKRVNYQGDIGLHVAKSIWGWQRKMNEDGMALDKLAKLPLKERIVYLGAAYAYGATKYEEDSPVGELAKAEMNALNKVIYDKSDAQVDELYTVGRKWSLEYFETIYQRLGTKFEEYFFESEEGPKGLKVVEEGLEKGVLEVGESGAVVFKGEQYGLHTRVFRNKLGLPTYEAKELTLPSSKYKRWAYDKSFIITDNEIDEYFKVLLKVLSLLSPELGAKTTHLSHGMMKLTTGKMSSRTGKVITGEGLLNELQEVVLLKMGDRDIKDRELVADLVAVGSLKYSVLKQSIGGDITYEPEKMTNMEGDTGPYLQYTYARTQSVLKKSAIAVGDFELREINPEELRLLKWIYRYPEVVKEAGEKYAPHVIALYVYELATRFNYFYNQHQIAQNEQRLALTSIVGNLLKSGLYLLGITAPEEM
jgi:arginyl-tRNA synthetase